MTVGLATEARRAFREGMTLVRQREGVLPSGLAAGDPGHECSVHIVSEKLVVSGSGLVISTEPVTACCGVVFQPDTLEVVAWGAVWPHEVCVRKTGHPRSFVSRVYQDARDSMLRRDASDEDMTASVTLVDKVFATRGRDWLRDDRALWIYDASFNGVFPGDRMCPRGRDLGLEPLTVEVAYPGSVHIHTCGVRDGCSRHLAHTETLSLNDIAAVERHISSQEVAATSISLTDLAWCLVTGDCSMVPVYEAIDPIRWADAS